MAKDLEIKLRITADGKVAVEQLGRVDHALSSVGDGAAQAQVGLSGMARGALALNELAESAGRIAGTVDDFVKMAEAFAQLRARLNLAVEGFGDAEQAMADVQAIADVTGQSMEEVGALYVKTAGAAKSLGIDQAQVARITKATAQAMRVAGASGQAAAGAIQQFSQALTSGTLRAEEFNSVVEAAPYLADQLAKGLGVARDELKRLVDQGLISSRDLAAAMQSQADEIGAAYGQLPQTVAQAMQRVRNALMAYLGGVNEASGITETLAGAVGLLAENVELIGPAAAGAAAGGLAKLTQAGAAQVASLKAQLAAMLAQRAALREQQAASLAAAQGAQVRAAADLQAAQIAQAAAVQRQIAAKQQLADMAALAVFGQQRAAAERQLSAANAQLAASEHALSAAQAKVAATTEAASLAMVGGAAKVGILSRALSFLAGPGGILLAAVAGFSAFAVAQRSTKDDIDDLTQALDDQRQRFAELGSRGLQQLVAQEEAHQKSLREQAARLRETSVALEEQIAALGRMTAAQKERTGAETRMTDMAKERTQVESELERVTAELLESEDSAAQARARLAEITPRLTAEEQMRAKSVTATIEALKRREEAETSASKTAQTHIETQIAQQKMAADRAKSLGDERGAIEATTRATALSVTQRRLEVQATEQAIARVREELAARQASGLAKRDELDKLQQTLAGLEAEAMSRRALVAAVEEQLEQAERETQTYGDQSANLADLLARRNALTTALAAYAAVQGDSVNAAIALTQAEQDLAAAEAQLAAAKERGIADLALYDGLVAAATQRVEQLTAATQGGAAAEERVAAIKKELAQVNALLADAARDATEAAERQANAARRELDLTTAKLEVAAQELQLDQDRARARGDLAEASRIAVELMDLEVDQARASAEAKRAEAAALVEKARVMQIAAEATGDYTAAEQEQVAAMQATAAVALQEATALDVVVKRKREAAQAAEETRLAEQAAAQAAAENAAANEQAAQASQKLASAGGAVVITFDDVLQRLGQTTEALGQYAGIAEEIYQRGLAEAVRKTNYEISLGAGSVTDHLGRLAEQAVAAANEVRRLDEQAQALNNQAADGVDALRERLLRLTGTEEELAAFRERRERLQIERQIKLNEILARRAEIEGDQALAASLREENALYSEQLKLLDQVQAAEREALQQRKAKDAKAEAARKRDSTSSEARENAAGARPAPAPGPARETTPAKTVRVELLLGGRKTAVDVREGQEDDLIDAIRRAGLAA